MNKKDMCYSNSHGSAQHGFMWYSKKNSKLLHRVARGINTFKIS